MTYDITSCMKQKESAAKEEKINVERSGQQAGFEKVDAARPKQIEIYRSTVLDGLMEEIGLEPRFNGDDLHGVASDRFEHFGTV
jgi:hypothetical protein